MAWCFREPNISRNTGAVDLLPKVAANFRFYLARKVVSLIRHCEHDALDF